MDVEAEVARHYTHSDLTGTVLAALRDAGRDIDALTTADLAPVDEFHLGWHPQTVALRRAARASRPARASSTSAPASAARRATSPRRAAAA